MSLASEVQDLHLAQRKEMASGFSKGPSLGLLPDVPSLMETLSYSYCYVGIMTGECACAPRPVPCPLSPFVSAPHPGFGVHRVSLPPLQCLLLWGRPSRHGSSSDSPTALQSRHRQFSASVMAPGFLGGHGMKRKGPHSCTVSVTRGTTIPVTLPLVPWNGFHSC